uniref:RNA exonuclease 4 n=1 Tax=Amblyomma triste TaxID=251400 RepID=A0A023GIS1_AMBTT
MATTPTGTPRQQKRKPKGKNSTIELAERHGYSPSKKGKTREKDSGSVTIAASSAVSRTKTAFPRQLQFASSNWKALQETLQIGQKSGAPQKVENRKKNTSKSSSTTVAPVKKEEVWFDGVDPLLLEPENVHNVQTAGQAIGLEKKGTYNKPTRVVAMDCEMVGVGHEGKDSVLARVSLVNVMGHCIYDKFVKPTEEVVDYRTAVSGVRPGDIEKGEEFATVQKEVSEILNGRILVGHAVHHDLKVLFLSHPRRRIRDTSAYRPFRAMFGGRTPSLKALSERILGVKVQQGEHSSVQDAQAAMRCYTMYRKQWEEDVRNGRRRFVQQRQQQPHQEQQDSAA